MSGLMFRLSITHKAEERRLFFAVLKYCKFKRVLLHNGNELPSVPVAYVVAMKETYEIMCHILQAIIYENHCWRICGDLKVIGLLMGLQSGFTKFPCFCVYGTAEIQKIPYKIKKCLGRDKFTPG